MLYYVPLYDVLQCLVGSFPASWICELDHLSKELFDLFISVLKSNLELLLYLTVSSCIHNISSNYPVTCTKENATIR